MLNLELDTIDENREVAAIQIAHYKQQAARYYNKNVRTRTFQIGDWVLRKVFQNTREIGAGKLGPNWEGPYEIVKVIGNGAYKLQTPDETRINNSWNALHLRRYYV